MEVSQSGGGPSAAATSGQSTASLVLQEPTFVTDSGKREDYKSALVSPAVDVSDLMESSESRPTGIADKIKKDLVSAISSPISVHNVRFETASAEAADGSRKRKLTALEPNTGPDSKQSSESSGYEPLEKKSDSRPDSSSAHSNLEPSSGSSPANMIGHGANEEIDDQYLPPNHKFQLI